MSDAANLDDAYWYIIFIIALLFTEIGHLFQQNEEVIRRQCMKVCTLSCIIIRKHKKVFFSTPISAYDCSDKLGYEKQFSFFYVIEDWQE